MKDDWDNKPGGGVVWIKLSLGFFPCYDTCEVIHYILGMSLTGKVQFLKGA